MRAGGRVSGVFGAQTATDGVRGSLYGLCAVILVSSASFHPRRRRPDAVATEGFVPTQFAVQNGAGLTVSAAVAPPIDRMVSRRLQVWLVAAIAVAGCAAPARSVAIALTSNDVDPVQAALIDWITIPYILAGLVAWWRRPESRLGLLMIAGGFASGLSALQQTQVDFLYTIGAAFDILPAALFLHVFLAFPEGRLRSRFERLLVGAAYTPSSTIRRFGGNKFPALLRAGHRATIALSRRTRRVVGLGYGPLPEGVDLSPRDGHPVVTFIACGRGEPSGSTADRQPVTFWSGSC